MHPEIKGLHLFHDALSEKEEAKILRFLEKQELSSVTASENSRKVVQYGARYDYNSKSAVKDVQEVPSELEVLRKRPDDYLEFKRKDSVTGYFNQCLVNRYLPGQGISAHIDSPTQFKGTVVCFTLGSGATMRFSKDEENVDVFVEPRSLYVMQGEARYEWKHSMVGRKSDPKHGQRGTRWSVTFRATK